MRLKFAWQQSDGELSPSCCSDLVGKDGVSPLCCLLMDDGGQGFLDTVSWLEEGLRQVRSVMEHGGSEADWDRDAWGAALTHNQAKIYSLHDEEYFEVLDIALFENALSEWCDFIQQEPKQEAVLQLLI